jgi:hypothetical protein
VLRDGGTHLAEIIIDGAQSPGVGEHPLDEAREIRPEVLHRRRIEPANRLAGRPSQCAPGTKSPRGLVAVLDGREQGEVARAVRHLIAPGRQRVQLGRLVGPNGRRLCGRRGGSVGVGACRREQIVQREAGLLRRLSLKQPRDVSDRHRLGSGDLLLPAETLQVAPYAVDGADLQCDGQLGAVAGHDPQPGDALTGEVQ